MYMCIYPEIDDSGTHREQRGRDLLRCKKMLWHDTLRTDKGRTSEFLT